MCIVASDSAFYVLKTLFDFTVFQYVLFWTHFVPRLAGIRTVSHRWDTIEQLASNIKNAINICEIVVFSAYGHFCYLGYRHHGSASVEPFGPWLPCTCISMKRLRIRCKRPPLAVDAAEEPAAEVH